MLLAIVKDTHLEAPEEFSKKATLFFAHVADKFYAKVNDDVYLNIGAALATHLDKPCVYIGCMQSGEVFSKLWYEPEWWKFGEKKSESWFKDLEGSTFGS
ncbi:hydroxyproline O-galactosyltransferase HPGT1-like [Rosa rugosa]|uniref:hydroxyproline O-galactosyltransferase HPGT1-like n=1 Tax=Rosa rugosa TaxID=74645 RepID=UPI002B409C91|nr:hydroxyproline O-galactosyltransferase HPGT1-like [Rosa rugosa]